MLDITYYYRVIALNVVGDSLPSNVLLAKVAAPDAPSDLTAIIMSANRVDLIWTDQSANESSFRIERSLDNFATAPSATFPVAARDVRTYSDASVVPTNTYSYRVVAVNGVGPSAPSNTATVVVNSKLQVGPVDPRSIFQGNPNSGYPGYYQDDQGTRVSLLPVTGNGLTAPTQIFDPVVASNPYSVFLGFGSENFYYYAESIFNTSAGQALAIFGLEGAFGAAGDAATGQEIVFNRTRIRLDLPAAGSYTVQHPYGSVTFNVTAADMAATGGRRVVNYTDDVGLAPRDFTQAANGNMTRFLRQTVPAPPAGWIGDGASIGPVTGSPTGFNKVRLTGPVGVNLDGVGGNVVESNLFMVSGRTPTAVTPLPSFTRTVSPATGVAPATMTFTDTSTGAPTAWLWDFGDGTTSTVQNPPAKIYNTPGNYTVRLTVTNAVGRVATSRVVSVYGPLTAGFTNSLPNGLPPVAISFTDSSTGNPASWAWTFGDGGTSTLQNPSHTYAAAGTYTVALAVTNPAGTATTSRTLSISASLVAGFTKTLAPASGVAPVTVTFTDASTGTITGWSWDFGDGSTSAVQNPPAKIYATPGSYTVRLTVTDAQGSAGTSQAVSVYGPLTASFTKSAARGMPPLTVSFTDTSTGNPASWLWDFGDGTTSTVQNPSKTYAAAGGYTVTLTVTNPAPPGTATTSQLVVVTSLDPALPLNLQVGPMDPRSIYLGNPNTGLPSYYQDDQGTRVGLLPLTAGQVFDPPVQANPYSVFLGFGSEAMYYMATATFNTAQGQVVAVFAIEQAFSGLSAVPGQEFTFTRTRLRAPAPIAGTYTLQHPWGSETLAVTAADVAGGIFWTRDFGSPRDFYFAAGGNINRFVRQLSPAPPAGWLGNGGLGTVTGSPTGFNKVRLTGPTGSNLGGTGIDFVETDQLSISARLYTGLTPSFTKVLAPASGVATVTVTFTGAATGGTPTSWLWDFGDGTTSAVQNPPAKTYATPGNYMVTLTVSDGVGTASTSQVVSVFGIPVASFTKSAASGAAPLTVSFTDTSTGNITGWLWDFGDTTTSTLQNPAKTYTAAGTFNVTLTASNPASPAGVVSAPQTVTVAGALPATPTGLTALVVSGTQVNLAWTDNSTNETGFSIERSTNGTTFAAVGTVAANIAAFNDLTATAGGTFFYRVVATSAAGNSAPSNVVQVTTAAPVAASFLAATAVPAGGVNLTWVDNANNESGFRIERATGAGAFAQIGAAAANATTFADPTTAPSTLYSYRVVAFNAIGPAAASNVATVTTAAATTLPAAPSGLSGRALAFNFVELTWTDNSNNESGFRIERATGAGAFAQVGVVAANVATFDDTTVLPDTGYQYRVFAVNTVGSSATAAGPVSVTTPAVPPATGGGGGGGGGGSAPAPVQLSGFTSATGLAVNPTTGVAQAAATVTTTTTVSGKGKATLTIAQGTKLQTAGGQPVTALSAAPPAAAPPAPPPQNTVVAAVEFGPAGAKFNPPITVAMGFDPATLPAGTRLDKLQIAYWDGAAWTKLSSTVDTATNTVTAQVSHFTVFSVMAEQMPPPTVKIAAPAEGAVFAPGNVTVGVELTNFELATPGQANVDGQGHIHYYLDVDIPAEPGKSASTAPGTYKSVSTSSVTWEGLKPGTHTLGVQLVGNDHRPLSSPVTARVSIKVVAPPALAITSPAPGATLPAGSIPVSIKVTDFELVAPGGANAMGKGHVHYYLDVGIPEEPGQPAVTAAGTYKAVNATSVTWDNVGPGTHTLGVQLVDNDHRPLSPPVVAKVTVTVAQPALALAPPTPPAPEPVPVPAPAPAAPTEEGMSWWLVGIGIAVVVLAAVIYLRRRSAY